MPGLNKRVTVDSGEPIPINIFQQFFDDEIIELMVTETKKYAKQFMENNQLRRNSRMSRWSEVITIEMKNLLGVVIIISGLIKYPNIEDCWKKDEIYHHHLFHKINMDYNRFVLILRNWHVSDNNSVPPGDRLYKISNFTKILISKYQEVYTSDEEISVEGTMISYKERLLFKQCNPGKPHKYGTKMFKLREMSGYVWNFSIYCGKASSENVPELDYSGTVVVSPAEDLLNEGRLSVADSTVVFIWQCF